MITMTAATDGHGAAGDIVGCDAAPETPTAVVPGAATDQSRFVVLEGAAAVRTPVLLSIAASTSEESGARVLRARCNAGEIDFPFGVVRQVFEMRLDAASAAERRTWLRGAAGLVPEVLRLDAGRTAGADSGPTCHMASHALFWLTVNIARCRPVVIVVDDLQWADAASLRWLIHLSRRMDGLPVVVLAGLSCGERVAEAALLAELLSGVPRVPVASVTEPAGRIVACQPDRHSQPKRHLRAGEHSVSPPQHVWERGEHTQRRKARLAASGPGSRATFGPAALTAHERRLIAMALDGRTNSEMAEQFKVTRRAIEFHFTHIYRKLDVTCRPQLHRFADALVP
jgi:DNA-binding CsgD family transcriptional regulator